MTIVFSVGRPGGQNLAAFHRAGKRIIVHTMVPIIPMSGPIIHLNLLLLFVSGVI